uniref:Capsid protein n=1 Tax=Genomoviridae sp. TaxID=2202565 RepID=A0A858NEB7_9VIRU|nr:MAG: capsid protein [Genomoviridae sp.]
MAYGRYARRRRATRRPARRPARRTRTRYRRTTTRRTRTRRPIMTTRRVNEISSTKKRDNMLTWSNVAVPRTPPPNVTGVAATLQGGGAYYNLLWCPTAREKLINTNTPVSVDDESTRATTVTFVKGLRERLSIQTNSSVPWTWRRIVFTMKGAGAFFGSQPLNLLTSNGYARLIIEVTGTSLTTLQDLVFDGRTGLDWRDPLDAKVDNSVISVKSDRTMVITPQTSSGAIKNFTRYYPIEKNLVYFEDEFGGNTTDGQYSVLGKQGMGDMLIYDIFAPRGGASFSDQMTLDIQSTYYWHEK